MSHRGGGSEKSQKSVTYYLNGPLLLNPKLAIHIDKIVNVGINVDIVAPGRARKGDRIGKVRFYALSTLIPSLLHL